MSEPFKLVTRSGLRFSAWEEPAIIQTEVDVTPLLGQAVEAELQRYYEDDASPEPSLEPSPDMSRSTTAPSTPLLTQSTSTLATLQHVSQRLQTVAQDATTSIPADTATQPMSHKERKKAIKRARARAAKQTQPFDALRDRRPLRASTSRKYASPRMITVEFVVASLTIARLADVGVNRPAGDDVESLDELAESHPDFRLVQNPDLQPLLIVDKKRNGFVAMSPGPENSDSQEIPWDEAIAQLGDFIDEVRDGETVKWLPKELFHRCGNYASVSAGITHGNGRKEPGNLKTRHPDAVEAFRNNKLVQRVIGHQDAVFEFYSPKQYKFSKDNVTELVNEHEHLERPFRNSIYTGFTVNMGPHSYSTDHLDSHNGVQQQCAVTSGGPYDPKFGGHLVLWDLKLIVEFPPGWTALLPSATLRHGNTRVRDGERRYSITQYISGNLFRWVRHKFRLAKNIPDAERRELDGTPEERLAFALSLYSKADELEADRVRCHNT